MPPEDLNAIRRLQALMDITRVVGSDESIASVLDAIATSSPRRSASRAW